MSGHSVDERWYRNGWVWLIIAIPGLTVAGCLVTIWLALAHPHILVKDSAPGEGTATQTPRDALR